MPQTTNETISGLLAGLVSSSSLHPMDLIKTRLQTDNKKYTLTNIIGTGYNIGKTVYKSDGIRGLYRGLTPNVLGCSLSWGLYFALYTNFKTVFNNGNQPNTNLQYFMSSSLSGALTLSITNPLFVVKTRMCTTNRNDKNAYPNLYKGLSSLIKNEGIKGVYKGYFVGVLLSSHGGVQFVVYERFKQYKLNKNNKKLDTTDYLVGSSLSKIAATLVTHPLQVIKARFQNNKNNTKSNVVKYVKDIIKNEGFSGLYKGLAIGLGRVLPGTCITFVVYENFNKYLSSF